MHTAHTAAVWVLQLQLVTDHVSPYPLGFGPFTFWKFTVRAAARYPLLAQHQAVAYRKVEPRPLVYGNKLVRDKQEGT